MLKCVDICPFANPDSNKTVEQVGVIRTLPTKHRRISIIIEDKQDGLDGVSPTKNARACRDFVQIYKNANNPNPQQEVITKDIICRFYREPVFVSG